MESDRAFYLRRRNEELRRAADAQDEGLQDLHRRWAHLYEKRLNAMAPPPPRPRPQPRLTITPRRSASIPTPLPLEAAFWEI